MIPKVVHYIWLGKGTRSKLMQQCMASWFLHLKGWRIQCWNEDNLPIEHPYVEKAMRLKQYAFASDYLRFHILEKYGGIYLDTDMELISSLDSFLDLNAFLGHQSPGRLNAGIIGSSPNHAFLKRVLEEYDLMTEAGKFEIICDVIERCYSKLKYGDISIFEQSHFYPYNPYHEFVQRRQGQLMYSDLKDDTVAIHHWAKTWNI
ncbi:MAG: glycosyltransferase [Cyanobacteria bacterium P01_C01_bin.120]